MPVWTDIEAKGNVCAIWLSFCVFERFKLRFGTMVVDIRIYPLGLESTVSKLRLYD